MSISNVQQIEPLCRFRKSYWLHAYDIKVWIWHVLFAVVVVYINIPYIYLCINIHVYCILCKYHYHALSILMNRSLYPKFYVLACRKKVKEPPRLGGKSRGSHGRPILLRPEPRTWRMHHADAVYLGGRYGRWTDSTPLKCFFFVNEVKIWILKNSRYTIDTICSLFRFAVVRYWDLMRVCFHSWTLRGVQVHSFWRWWHPQTHLKERNASNLGYLFLSKSCFEMHDLQIQFATEPSNLHGAMTAPKPMSCVCFPNYKTGYNDYYVTTYVFVVQIHIPLSTWRITTSQR